MLDHSGSADHRFISICVYIQYTQYINVGPYPTTLVLHISKHLDCQITHTIRARRLHRERAVHFFCEISRMNVKLLEWRIIYSPMHHCSVGAQLVSDGGYVIIEYLTLPWAGMAMRLRLTVGSYHSFQPTPLAAQPRPSVMPCPATTEVPHAYGHNDRATSSA